jgi:hypothetical protein
LRVWIDEALLALPRFLEDRILGLGGA